MSFKILPKNHIILCWVQSHVDIRGNKKADSAAKSALDFPHAKVGVPYNDFKHSYILRKDPPPQCEHSQCILTVCHILVVCNHFDQERKDIFG